MFKIAIKNLIHRRARTLLTASGITIGIAALVVLIGISEGVRQAAYNSVSETSSYKIIDVLPNIQGNRLFQLVAPGKGDKLTEKTLEEVKKLDHIANIYPEYTVKKAISIEGTIFGQTLKTDSIVLGIEEDYIKSELPENQKWEVEKGVIPFLISSRLLEMYNFTIAQTNNLPILKQEDFIGREVNIFVGESTLISGLKSKEGVLRGRIVGFSPKVDLIGITVPDNSLHLFGSTETHTLNKIHVEVDQISNLEFLAAKIEELGYSTEYIQKRIEGLQKTFSFLFLGLSSISLTILIVSALSILNIFLASVRERQHGIGVMRSLGATKKQILEIFLLEASLIGFLGATSGAILGYASSFVIDKIIRELLPVQFKFLEDSLVIISFELVVFSLIFGVVLSTISALIPAYKASRLDPVKALKG